MAKSKTKRCRFCGRDAAPANCSLCGRRKCEACTTPKLSGIECGACRVEIYTILASRRYPLRITPRGILYSLCGDVSRLAAVYVKCLVPEAIEEAGGLKHVLETKGYTHVQIVTESKNVKERRGDDDRSSPGATGTAQPDSPVGGGRSADD